MLPRAQRLMVITSDRETERARIVAADIEGALWHHDAVLPVTVIYDAALTHCPHRQRSSCPPGRLTLSLPVH